MKRAYVLVEGPTDAEFLRRVLPPESLREVEVVSAAGKSGIASLAGSLLVRRRRPVAVFMDSHSLHPDVIYERRQTLEDLLKLAAASVPVKVVAAVPEMEAYFFAAPEAIERVLGAKVPDDLLTLGPRDPKGVLGVMAKQTNREWDSRLAIKSLDDRDIERMRAAPPLRELTAFLQSLQEPNAA
jgi:hypothetical protein